MVNISQVVAQKRETVSATGTKMVDISQVRAQKMVNSSQTLAQKM